MLLLSSILMKYMIMSNKKCTNSIFKTKATMKKMLESDIFNGRAVYNRVLLLSNDTL